jgi:hypothetical protein
MIDKPKKERRFLKTLGKIGEILLQEVLIKIGSSLIKRIGGKKTLPSILFLFLSVCVFAQYPATGNKQRLGYQTTGDGLVFRGRASDTVALKSSTINNSYVILDTINNVMLVYIKTKGGWKYNNADTIIVNNNTDTTSLSSRINLKVNISDTASMLLKYLRKADTSLLNLNTRFAAKLNLLDTASMLTNYLRSGVAASTYLPLTGGTLTGALDINTENGSNSYQDSTLKVTYNQSSLGLSQNVTGIYSSVNTTGWTSTGLLSEASTIYTTAIGVKGKATQNDVNGLGVAYGIVGETAASGIGTNGSTFAGYFNNTSTVGGNHYGLYVSTASGGDYGIYQTGAGTNYFGSNSTFNGTLGVTGAATLTSTLSVTGNITEGGNNVLTNLDTTSLSSRVDGKVSLNGDETINGSKSFQNQVNVLNRMTLSGSVSGLNKLLGKNTDGNGVGDITVGSGLNLSANTLTAPVIDTASMLNPYWRSGRFSGTLPITNGGTGATSESNARTNLKVDYVFIATNAGAGVAVTTNRVFIVNSGGSLTTTLDLTTLTSGNTYMIKNLASGTIVSSANNVIPLNGGSASTPILSAGNVTPQWCTLVCDGTNWHIMQKN